MDLSLPYDRKINSRSVTTELSEWVAQLKWEDVPDKIKDRTKFLILDGIGCALVGAHLPWSEEAVEAVLKFETPGGDSPIVGWKGRKTGLVSAALLNSTFIQGFELDDYHSYAPLHSNSIILPTLLSLCSKDPSKHSGRDFILATIVGFEVGPRVGKSIGGSSILSLGWHSGAVLLTVYLAVTSTSSAQMISVSSILSFDIYKKYINPQANNKQMIRVAHFGVVFFGLFAAGFTLMLHYVNVNMTWMGYFMSIVICPGVFPLIFTVTWDRQTTIAAFVAPITGLVFGFAVWITTTNKLYGEITIDTLGMQIPCLYASLTALFLSLIHI